MPGLSALRVLGLFPFLLTVPQETGALNPSAFLFLVEDLLLLEAVERALLPPEGVFLLFFFLDPK